MCKKCYGCTKIDKVTPDGDVIEKETKFSYLGDVLSSEGEVHKAVTARTRSGWKKFKAIASILCKKIVSLNLRGNKNKICVRNLYLKLGRQVLGFEDEKKVTNHKNKNVLRMICDKK